MLNEIEIQTLSKTNPNSLYAITERDGKTFWTRLGRVLVNLDGSLKIEASLPPHTEDARYVVRADRAPER